MREGVADEGEWQDGPGGAEQGTKEELLWRVSGTRKMTKEEPFWRATPVPSMLASLLGFGEGL